MICLARRVPCALFPDRRALAIPTSWGVDMHLFVIVSTKWGHHNSDDKGNCARTWSDNVANSGRIMINGSNNETRFLDLLFRHGEIQSF